MSVALVLPSRGRPELYKRMVNSAVDTAANPDGIFVMVGLNEDDTTSPEYYHGVRLPPFHHYTMHFDKASKGREIWNTLSKAAIANKADWVWIGSDDVLFETKGWDTKLPAVDTPHVFSGNDGSCSDRHFTHPFLNSAWLKTVGKAMPLCCAQFCGDSFITELAKATGTWSYAPNVSIRHMNPKYGLGIYDDTWKNTKPLQELDGQQYFPEGSPGRAEVAEALNKIRGAIEAPRVARPT